MKYFVVIAALCTYVLGETLLEHGEKVMEQAVDAGAKCAEELGASPEDLDKLSKRELPETRAGVCVIACVNKIFGLQNADGTIKKDSTLANVEEVKDIDEDIYKKMASVWNTCSSNTANDSDECNTGVNLAKCMKEASEKLGLTKEVIGF